MCVCVCVCVFSRVPPRILTAHCGYVQMVSRPGYHEQTKAHEYFDAPDVLLAKVKALADLIRRSRHMCAYTGAGISTSSGINDYASKAGAKSVAVGEQVMKKLASPLLASPTISHRVLAAMHPTHLKHWVQQNHDGLPQKAGFPQEALNEIHGAWFDPSNPVVPMSGNLRDDLIERLMEWEAKADLVLVLGTSLSGMNADRMVRSFGSLSSVLLSNLASRCRV